QIGRIVEVEPRRQNLGFEDRRRNRRALQLLDGVEQRVRAVPPFDDALPRCGEAAEDCLIHRLDLVAQPGQRPPAPHCPGAGGGPTPRAPRPPPPVPPGRNSPSPSRPSPVKRASRLSAAVSPRPYRAASSPA